LTYISYFDTYDCTHNGDEPPKDSSEAHQHVPDSRLLSRQSD